MAETRPAEQPGLLHGAQQLHALAASRRHRGVLLLSGESGWCRREAQQLVAALDLTPVFWFGDCPDTAVPSGKGRVAREWLGSELQLLVFDLYSGFDADAFGALCGCLRDGGLLLMLVPPGRDWSGLEDPESANLVPAGVPPGLRGRRYLRRLSRVFSASRAVAWWSQREGLQSPTDIPSPAANPSDVEHTPPSPDSHCLSSDQQQAVEAVVHVVRGHRRRPLVLTSDRGRGKSAAFGIAAAELIASGCKRIVLTAPRRRAVHAVEAHARALLDEAQAAALVYRSPDELLRDPVQADLLLVDEAAGIPAPVLETLLRRYSRVAFATTVHGYEGTGRGFAIRFNQVLDRHSNSWKALHLHTPVRWAGDDPLEALVNRALLLDAEPATAESFGGGDGWTFEQLDRDRLLEDADTLRELFGLLVAAHYRTRPFDLRHLLDAPNLSVHIARLDGHVAAAAVVLREGGFDVSTAGAIWAGERRPRGHLLPELLAAQLGLAEAPPLHAARIMRIAVHPSLRRCGIATGLLARLAQHAGTDGCDYIGSSFGLNDDLLGFWRSTHWQPVWISTTRGASSGSHSAVWLLPLNTAGRTLCKRARQRFIRHFPQQLAAHLRDLEAGLVVALLQAGGIEDDGLEADDWQDVLAFCRHRRMPEVCAGSLWRLVLHAAADAGAWQCLTPVQRDLLVLRVLQARSWRTAVARTGADGRARAVEIMREAVANLYDYYSGSRKDTVHGA